MTNIILICVVPVVIICVFGLVASLIWKEVSLLMSEIRHIDESSLKADICCVPIIRNESGGNKVVTIFFDIEGRLGVNVHGIVDVFKNKPTYIAIYDLGSADVLSYKFNGSTLRMPWWFLWPRYRKELINKMTRIANKAISEYQKQLLIK